MAKHQDQTPWEGEENQPTTATPSQPHTQGMAQTGETRLEQAEEKLTASPGHSPRICHCKNSQYTWAAGGAARAITQVQR